VIPFNSRLFGTAANNGQMVAEISANHRVSKTFLDIAHQLTGLGDVKKPRTSLLAPIIGKLRPKAARA
jgi:pilus assembly protein CpaE